MRCSCSQGNDLNDQTQWFVMRQKWECSATWVGFWVSWDQVDRNYTITGQFWVILYLGVSENSGTPQIIHFNRVFHYKPSILGYHYFWKHLFVESDVPKPFRCTHHIGFLVEFESHHQPGTVCSVHEGYSKSTTWKKNYPGPTKHNKS